MRLMAELKTSIVVSMYNAKASTIEVIDKLFFPSLIRNLSGDKEVIIIDDNSPLEQATNELLEKYLEEIKAKSHNVITARNETNLGFAKSYNRGIKASSGKDIIVVNDDVYFPVGSIDSLLRVLNSDASFGSVAPSSNNAYSYQNVLFFDRIKGYSKDEINRIERFSNWLREVMENTIILPKNRMTGFCLALRKDMLDEIGYFDERFSYGMFEDDDLDRRIRAAGYKVALDAGNFIEHGGVTGQSTSILQYKGKAVKAFIENIIKFMVKHNSYLETLKHCVTMNLNYHFGLDTVTDDIIRKIEEKV